MTRKTLDHPNAKNDRNARIIEMRRDEKKTLDDIADEMGISASRVSAILNQYDVESVSLLEIRYSRDDMIESLRSYYDEHGVVPSRDRLFERLDSISCAALDHFFGDYRSLLAQAELPPNYSESQKTFSDDELRNTLRTVNEQTSGDRLSVQQYQKQYEQRSDTPSFSVFVSRFGSWNEALEYAGIEPRDPYVDDYSQQSDVVARDEILKTLYEWIQNHGTIPTMGQWEQGDPEISCHVIRHRFGRWSHALEQTLIQHGHA